MSVAAMNTLFGVLALAAIGVAAAATVWTLSGRSVSRAQAENALQLALVIATVTTAGSLYYSNIAGFTPCTLCWYQRIALYPQVVILAVATLRKDLKVWTTAVPIAGIGILLSVWHIALERSSGMAGSCDVSNPCAVKWVEEFGFLTIPTMALAAGASIAALTLLASRAERRDVAGREEVEV